MKKLLVAIVSCLATHGLAFSQVVEKSSSFQLTLFPPLSTNGVRSYQYTNNVSLNLLVGLSRNEEAVAIAGLANITTHEANGLQFAGIINVANDINGLQFGGLINKAKNVNGVQFAGLINIAENSDYPIGLINIIKNGEKGIAITYNESGSVMATFRSGGKVTYGIIGVGYNHKTSGRSYATEAGFGFHINCLSWLRINNELKIACFGYSNKLFVVDDGRLSNTVFNVNYSILPAFRLSSHFELFGGPSLNYMNSGNADKELDFKHAIWEKTGSTRFQQIYVGYQVGVQYIF